MTKSAATFQAFGAKVYDTNARGEGFFLHPFDATYFTLTNGVPRPSVQQLIEVGLKRSSSRDGLVIARRISPLSFVH